jgi:hypothetical protein
MNNICYVTLFYDIGRDNWNNIFKRSFEDYYGAFEPYINLFNKDTCNGDKLIVFIDKNYCDILKDRIKGSNIFLISIDNNFMSNLYCWKKINKEREIMNDENFKKLVAWRISCPEHSFPEYTLINHSKIDLICWLIDNFSEFNYYAWVDFGFFKNKDLIPSNLIDINKLELNTINYTLINPIDEYDNDIFYTLKYAPEKIGGFFFFGRTDKLLEYQKLYHEVFDWFQSLNIADDDQHLVLQSYFKNHKLFTLHCLYGWHKAFIHFQK